MLPWRQCLVVATLVLSGVSISRAADKKKMPESERFGRFTVDQVERRLNQPNVHVFDGNPSEIYAENHLPGALRLNSKEIKEGVLPADKDGTLIFYCMNEL